MTPEEYGNHLVGQCGIHRYSAEYKEYMKVFERVNKWFQPKKPTITWYGSNSNAPMPKSLEAINEQQNEKTKL